MTPADHFAVSLAAAVVAGLCSAWPLRPNNIRSARLYAAACAGVPVAHTRLRAMASIGERMVRR